MRTRFVAGFAVACVALGFLAGRLASRAWTSVVDYRSPYRFTEPSAPGERLDWRAILVVIDGLRDDASRRMPGLDRFRMQGADLSATTGIPSYSRPGRANLVTGAPPEIHGATTNLHKRTLEIDNLFRGLRGTGAGVAIAGSDLWRSLFGPDLAGAAFLESPIEELRGGFEQTAPRMISFEWKALRFLLSQKKTLGVLDLVVPDYAAHEYGAKSPQYGRALVEADRVLGGLADEVDLWRTLVIVTADHGQLDEGGHGGSEPEVTTVPLVIAGRGVRVGATGTVRQIDVAPTLAVLLGLPIPAGSEGRVLSEVLDSQDPPPGFEAREKVQQAAFARDLAASLGVAGGASGDDARATRLAADQRARLPIALAIAASAFAMLAWLAWPRKAPLLASAVAGALLQEGAFRLLVAAQHIRLSLSAINHEEDLGPYFARVLALAALAMVVSLAIVSLAAARLDREALALHGLAAVLGAGLFLGAQVLSTYADQGLFMAWRIGDIARGFDAFVDLVRLQAVGYSAALVLLLAWWPARESRSAAALALVLLALPAPAQAATVVTDVPAHPDPAARYLIYLHGRILETEGRDAVSPEYGRYEYDAILKAFADSGVVVISELRGPSTGFEYAKRVAAQVRRLNDAGVPGERIAIVGFSKGGYLARAAAAEIANPAVRYVIEAGCPQDASNAEPFVPRMKGRMLSLYDSVDKVAGSCQGVFAHAPDVSGQELVLKLGKGHGAFYAPRKEWLDPVLAWMGVFH